MGQVKHCEEPPPVSACLAFLEDWNFCFYLTLKRFVPEDNIKEIKRLREKKALSFSSSIQHVGICLGSHFYLLRLDKSTNEGEEECLSLNAND